MKNLSAALYLEFFKTKKSKIFWSTIVVFSIIPLFMGIMMFIARNPEIGKKLGLIGMKANMFGDNDWKGYFSLLTQVIASIGLIGFGFVNAWVFGSEHTDKTMKDLLALPVRRSTIVFAKTLIASAWSILLAFVLFVVGVSLGFAMDLPSWSNESFLQFTYRFFVCAILTLALSSPVSYLAGYSHGIIAPLGFVIFSMIMAQFVALIGIGPYFPWAIPGLFSVGNDSPGMQLSFASYIILFSTFSVAYYLTVYWWEKADHH